MATITAAMIVRDEEAMLGACLASIEGIVDEAVVVDTGSVDGTREIARRFNVKLLDRPWTGDFAAVRNFALAQSAGDWILYIDADERLEPTNRAALQPLLDDNSVAGWQLRFHPRPGTTGYAETRLFRNDPRIRFQGRIHEQIIPSLDRAAAEDGRRTALSKLAIHHVGYEGDLRRKHARNLPLLRAYLEENPERSYCWWHLGSTLSALGDHAGARQAWQRGIDLVRGRPDGAVHSSDCLIYLEMIELGLSERHDVSALLAEACRRFPERIAFVWARARYRMAVRDHAAAMHDLARIAAIDGSRYFDPWLSYDRRLFGQFANEALGVCAFRLDRFAEAAAHFERALAAEPSDVGLRARLTLARARAGTVTVEGAPSGVGAAGRDTGESAPMHA